MKFPVLQPLDVAGIHYAIRILIGSSIAWIAMGNISEINPLWAVISLISVTDPQIKTAYTAFKAQAFNTVIGCITGLAFIAIAGIKTWMLPIVATITAIISIHIFRMQAGWRTGPITAALVMSAGLVDKSEHGAMTLAVQRALGVFTGSLIALVVTGLMALIWMPKTVAEDAKKITK